MQKHSKNAHELKSNEVNRNELMSYIDKLVKKNLNDLGLKGTLSKLRNIEKKMLSNKLQINFEEALKRKSISYLLGWSVVDAYENKKNIISLPEKLYKIYKENNYRKTRAIVKKEFLADNPKKFKKENELITVSNVFQNDGMKVKLDFVDKFPRLINGNNSNNSEKILTLLDEEFSKGFFWRYDVINIELNDNLSFLETDFLSFEFVKMYISIDILMKYSNLSSECLSVSAEKIRKFANTKNIPIVWLVDDLLRVDKFFVESISSLGEYVLHIGSQEVLNCEYNDLKIINTEYIVNQAVFNPANNGCFELEEIVAIDFFPSLELNSLYKKIKSKFSITMVSILSGNNESKSNLVIDERDVSSFIKSGKLYVNFDAGSNGVVKIIQAMMSGLPVLTTVNSNIQKPLLSMLDEFEVVDNFDFKIKHLLSKKWDYRRESHLGYRYAITNHSFYYLDKVVREFCGSDVGAKKVSIISATMRANYIERLVNSISCQKYSNIEAIIVTQDFTNEQVDLLRERLDKCVNLVSFQIVTNNTSDSLGVRLNLAANLASGDYIAKFDDDDYYFENYLSDMLLPFTYGDFGVVGKLESFVYLEEHNKTYQYFVDKGNRISKALMGGTLVITAMAFKKIGGFSDLRVGEDKDLLGRMSESGFLMYASDPFNYLYWRASNQQSNTWKTSSDTFISNSCYVADGTANNIVSV